MRRGPRPCLWSRRLACIGVTLGLATSVTACGGKDCGDREASDATSAPMLDSFWVLDAQIPGDPWTVLYGADFMDGDGDLSGGQAEFYLNNNEEPASQALEEIFRQSGVALGETTGSLWMALHFSDTLSDDASPF